MDVVSAHSLTKHRLLQRRFRKIFKTDRTISALSGCRIIPIPVKRFASGTITGVGSRSIPRLEIFVMVLHAIRNSMSSILHLCKNLLQFLSISISPMGPYTRQKRGLIPQRIREFQHLQKHKQNMFTMNLILQEIWTRTSTINCCSPRVVGRGLRWDHGDVDDVYVSC
jgi:hypothetical protein